MCQDFAISGWMFNWSSSCTSPLNNWLLGQMVWGFLAKAGSRVAILLCSLYLKTKCSLSCFCEELHPWSIIRTKNHKLILKKRAHFWEFIARVILVSYYKGIIFFQCCCYYVSILFRNRSFYLEYFHIFASWNICKQEK